VGRHVRELDRRLMRGRIALNAALFYPSLLAYTPDLRQPLLDWQQRVASGHPLLERAFDRVHGWIDRRLERAVRGAFSASPA